MEHRENSQTLTALTQKIREMKEISRKKYFWDELKSFFGKTIYISLIGLAGYIGFLGGKEYALYHINKNSEKLIIEKSRELLKKTGLEDRLLKISPLGIILGSSSIVFGIGYYVTFKKRKRYEELFDKKLDEFGNIY